jgi:hypothetical protein
MKNTVAPTTKRTEPVTRTVFRSRSGGVTMWGRKKAVNQRVAGLWARGRRNGLNAA